VIEFQLSQPGQVDLQIFDVQGRLVRILVAGVLEAGIVRMPWDGRDDGGLPVGSGVYYTRLVAPGGTFTRSIIHLK
jgi:flagellar hook assembly protein FlgD